jgi:hypothetical protein
MSETLLITPSLGDVQITAAQDARDVRDALLIEASTVTTVVDRIDADSATSTLRALKAYQTAIESARTKVKGPVLDVGRKIDALAKELADKVTTEASRISRIIGAFETEERRKAEVLRIEAENRAADIARKAAEEAAKAARAAPTAEAADRAADAVREKAAEQIVAVKQQAAQAVATKQAGTSVREDVVFEVQDIKALYAAHPELVLLEPNGTAIRAILRNAPNLQLPGVRHWREAKLNVR